MHPRHRSTRAQAAMLAGTRHADAVERGDAVVVGNRAGVVEWANEAWTQLTGFPLAETLDKPITHFLARAGIEIELVEFVAQHFLDGRRCTVELAFETFDDRAIDVHLEVEPVELEPVHTDGGEERCPPPASERFVAIAREVRERPGPRSAATRDSLDDRIGNERLPGGLHHGQRSDAIIPDPTILVREAIERVDRARSSRVWVDAVVPQTLPAAACDGAKLRKLLDTLLLDGSRESPFAPPTLTVIAGLLEPKRRHVSLAHPIPCAATAQLETAHLFIEVHDVFIEVHDVFIEVHDVFIEADDTFVEADGALYRARGAPDRAGGAPDPRRESTHARLQQLAREAGVAIHLDETPGCGRQAVVVIPIAEASGR